MKAERILYLMLHPDITSTKFCKMFECSRRTFERDKEYIRDRLYMYEVKNK